MLTASLLAFVIVAAVAQASRQPHERVLTEPGGLEARRAGPVTIATSEPRGSSSGSVSTYRGHTARYYARLAYQRGQHAKRWKRVALHRGTVTEAINLACATYGYCDTLWRKARCESGLNPNARNGSEASGLLQFLPSTWRTTPYARFSIFSPYANALAAGWMHAHGRGGEWSCR